VSPKRGDRATPPPRPDEYDLRFANTEAAKGWDELCRQAPGNTRTAFDAICADPSPAPATDRHHRLKHDLATGVHNGQTLDQWQYEDRRRTHLALGQPRNADCLADLRRGWSSEGD
jgi:hypothetical protein